MNFFIVSISLRLLIPLVSRGTEKSAVSDHQTTILFYYNGFFNFVTAPYTPRGYCKECRSAHFFGHVIFLQRLIVRKAE
jgi:hypothetical protein